MSPPHPDYSVCTTWGQRGRQLFLLHVLRKRLEYPDLKRAIIAQAAMFGATTVLIEDAASGIALIQELKSDGFYKATAVKPKGDKVMRMQAQTAVIEAGQVFVPLAASWLEDYLHEIMMFPASRHYDQVDSTSQALGYAFSTNTNFDSWIAFYESRGRAPEPEVANIRVNFVDRSMQFYLCTGRVPQREADGSFLLTDEEYRPLAGMTGLTRLDEP